ncbi:MAG: hypothetical protein MJZ92_04635, partial [Paludibacteraceae bacterium]|nr:hypothetical protein [Paludibacteraceae bacterium]
TITSAADNGKQVTLSTIHDCDSIVTLDLTVYPTYEVTDPVMKCESALPFEWNGETIASAADNGKQVTLKNIHNCDSVVTLALTITNTIRTTDQVTKCDNELPFTWNDIEIKTIADNGKQATLSSSAGCDSIVTLALTLYPTYNVSDPITKCGNELPFTWNGETISSPADNGKQVTLKTIHDCDSIVTLVLTVNPTYNETENITKCASELPFTWNGETITSAADNGKQVTLSTIHGCDSIVTLHLTINPSYQVSDPITKRSKEFPFAWNGEQIISEADNGKQVTLTTINGCDSTVTLDLHVIHVNYYTEYITLCENELPFVWNGINIQSMADNGKSVTLPDVYGDDSIVTLQLTLHQSFPHVIEEATICENALPYRWNGYDLDKAGVYQLNLPTVHGCDSVITFTLNVQKAQDLEVTDQTCTSLLPFTWQTWRTHHLTETGTYRDTLRTPQGCDSIRYTLHLTVNASTLQGYVTMLQDTLCADDDFITLTFRNTQGKAEYFNLVFDRSAQTVGFQDIPRLMMNGNERTVTFPIPAGATDKEYARPDTYYGSVEVANPCDEITNIPFHFTLLYPSWIILQRWNDVLALYNENYNGGYTFSDIRWFHNGMPIEGTGAHNSQIYAKDFGQETLDFGTEYWAELTRTSDGKTLRTCAVVPQYQDEVRPTKPNAPQITLSPTIISGDNRIVNIDANISGQYIMYYSNGKRLQTGKFGDEYGNSTLSVEPNYPAGTYIVVFYGDEGSVISHKLFLK